MITDYTTQGKCSNCGACCSDFLPLSDNDIRRIKVYIAEHHIKDIKNAKSLFHQKYAPVNMRAVFFGSDELERLLNEEINKSD